MTNTVAQQETFTYQARGVIGLSFELYHRLRLALIPLTPKSKVLLGRWSDESWKPSLVEIEPLPPKPVVNWGVHRGKNVALIIYIYCGLEVACYDFGYTVESPPVSSVGVRYSAGIDPNAIPLEGHSEISLLLTSNSASSPFLVSVCADTTRLGNLPYSERKSHQDG